MAGVESGQAAEDDAAAREAAEVAVELSEAEGPPDKKRIIRALQYVAGRGADAVRRGSGAARRGAGTAGGTVARTTGGARKRAGSAGRGVTSGLSWLTAQVVAMGPRLKIRDQATLRAQFPGRTDDDIAGLLVERAARATATVGGATGAGRGAAGAAGVPGRGRGGDAGGGGDRDQAAGGAARDLRPAGLPAAPPTGRAPTSAPGPAAAACTRWTAGCSSSRARRWPGS